MSVGVQAMHGLVQNDACARTSSEVGERDPALSQEKDKRFSRIALKF